MSASSSCTSRCLLERCAAGAGGAPGLNPIATTECRAVSPNWPIIITGYPDRTNVAKELEKRRRVKPRRPRCLPRLTTESASRTIGARSCALMASSICSMSNPSDGKTREPSAAVRFAACVMEAVVGIAWCSSNAEECSIDHSATVAQAPTALSCCCHARPCTFNSMPPKCAV
jgi:hypothetical protein